MKMKITGAIISALLSSFMLPQALHDQQPKLYTVSLTIEQWQAAESAIRTSDLLSAKASNKITTEIVTQINKQLSEQAAKDSIKKK